MRRIQDPFEGTAGDEDYGTMIQIVNERTQRNQTLQSLLPDDQTLVIHLRTGDVIDKSGRPIREFLGFPVEHKGVNYTRGLPYFAGIWQQIQNEHVLIERILVITGWHIPMPHFRSIAYINEVIKYLEQMVDRVNIRVNIRVNENPDEDFIIMSHSNYYVKTGGGYSDMIGGMVERKGGRVFAL